MTKKFTNNAASKLASPILSTDISFTVTSGDGVKFPVLGAGETCHCTLLKVDGTNEIVLVTARATDVFTMTRAQENTTAMAFNAGDRVEHRITAGDITGLQTDIATSATAAAAAQTTANTAVTNAATADGKAVAAQATANAAMPKAGGSFTGLYKTAKGADIASAATIDLSTATGNTVLITGTTTITGFTMTAGQVMDVIFNAPLTLTYHATNNNLPGGASIIVETGDRARYYYDGTTINCLSFNRASGRSVVDRVGEYIHWPINTTPSYALVCNGAAVSRTTYKRLFNIIGTYFGAGDGSTTFNLPGITPDYVLSHSLTLEGSTTIGQNLAHTHDFISFVSTGGGSLASNSVAANSTVNTTTASGGTSNLAASVRTRICIIF